MQIGIMICTKRVTFSDVAFSTVSGSLYLTQELSINSFAENFTKIDAINANVVDQYAVLVNRIVIDRQVLMLASSKNWTNANVSVSIMVIRKMEINI